MSHDYHRLNTRNYYTHVVLILKILIYYKYIKNINIL